MSTLLSCVIGIVVVVNKNLADLAALNFVALKFRALCVFVYAVIGVVVCVVGIIFFSSSREIWENWCRVMRAHTQFN